MTSVHDGASELEWQVAPYPGDVVLGAGATMARLARAGVRLCLLAVTDGAASPPLTTAESVRLRRAQRETALGRLGLDGCRVLHCHLGVGAVADAEDELAERIEELLEPGAWCLSTWRHDGHPDREAVGRAAGRATTAVGARLLSYPVGTWRWALPGDLRVPWSAARQVPLDRAAVLVKGAAALAFSTNGTPGTAQARPPLSRLMRDVEVFLL